MHSVFVRYLVAMGLVSLVSFASACSEDSKSAGESKIEELSVDQAAGLIESGDAVAIDANGANVRKEHGIVPGARLLSSASDYKPNRVLPTDKSTKLVFYCANPKCGASETAAKKARKAGYTNVSIMPGGIMGWAEAGQKTAEPPSS